MSTTSTPTTANPTGSTPAPAPPALNFTNIQGDIILGLPKKVEEYVFFQITDTHLFKKQLNQVIPYITTMAEVQHDLDLIAAHKKLDKNTLIKLTGTNISFSQFGLTKLGITEDLGDVTFKAGQAKDAEALGDKGTGTGDSFVPNWDQGFKNQIDGLLLFSAESKETLAERRAELHKVLHGCYHVVEALFCNVRPGAEKGHEHFGFLDGISEPGVTGSTKLHKGQDAVSPAVFLLGNDMDTRTSTLAKDGSFLAFRKLNQLVPEFNSFLLHNGTGLDGMTPQEGADFLGARLVGRWKSGAPIDIATLKDDPALGADPERNNDFNFSFTNPDDQTDQTRCPFAAHIRKAYPRQDLEKFVNIDKNRIIRQGCPFGPELTHEETHEGRTLQERGLAFACYQSVLANGFSFIQKSWVNTTTFPPKQNPDGSTLSPGFDPLIGQAGSNTRSMVGFDPKAQGNSLSLPAEFVVSRGGEYFFVPSIRALKEVFAVAF